MHVHRIVIDVVPNRCASNISVAQCRPVETDETLHDSECTFVKEEKESCYYHHLCMFSFLYESTNVLDFVHVHTVILCRLDASNDHMIRRIDAVSSCACPKQSSLSYRVMVHIDVGLLQ
jgi:hypothetical protein